MRISVITVALAAAALALGAGSASAKSCASAVLDDWYVDNTIDGRYAATCYRQALSRVSDQMSIYSDLPEQLQRGLREALLREAHVKGATKTIRQGERATAQSHKPNGPIQRVLGELGPDRADSIPIPLMILAGVALLLIAAGAASALVRRLNGRRNSP